MTSLTRTTKETTVEVSLGEAVSIDTGQPFLDHLLTAFASYAALPLVVRAKGDLPHHVSEDVALTVGAFVRRLTPQTCARYGERTIPMDEALVQVVLDAGGRAFFAGRLPSGRATHWLRSFATAAECTLHVVVHRGEDKHHVVEAAFKALGLALRQALRDEGAVFSTKGRVAWKEEP